MDVQIEGLRRVGKEAALSGIKTKAGASLEPKIITQDLRTIWGTGFFRDVRIRKERTEGGVNIIIEVREKPSIREVHYTGNDELSDEDIEEVVDVRPFTILNVDLLKRNIAKIKDLYVEKGYYLAEVDYKTTPIDGNEHEVDVVFNVVENAKVVVRQISFVGNEQIESEEIKGSIQTREGTELSWLTQAGTYKEEFFQSDIFRIQALYYDRGFVTVKVGDPSATISSDRRFIYLSIPIEEGLRYQYGKIDFSGDLELKNEMGKVLVDRKKVDKRLTIKPGETFSRTKLFQDIQAITDVYRDHGYAYANVTPNSSVNNETRTVDLDLSIERGDIVHIERIEVVGNSKTRDKVIRREMRIFEGDKYSASLINRSRARIFQLGFFEEVNITTNRGSRPDLMDIKVEIKERSTGTFQIGAGFSSVESFIATAQISQNNFLGNGQTLSLSAQLSFGDFARQLVNLQFVEPYFLDTRWSLGINGFITQRIFRDFQRNSKGFSPQLWLSHHPQPTGERELHSREAQD